MARWRHSVTTAREDVPYLLARVRELEAALRELVDGQSVEAFIGYMPMPETAREIEAKFERGRAALAAPATTKEDA